MTQPSYQSPPPRQKLAGEDNAVLALVMGILGIILCGPLGIAAFVMGRKARKESALTGVPVDSKMEAAYILGIVGTVLVALSLILLFVFLLISLIGLSAA